MDLHIPSSARKQCRSDMCRSTSEGVQEVRQALHLSKVAKGSKASCGVCTRGCVECLKIGAKASPNRPAEGG